MRSARSERRVSPGAELDRLRIGTVRSPAPWILAPMAGITDPQFRRILRRLGGVGIVTMEFMPADGIARGDRRTRRLMRYAEEERPLSIQIYGSNPERMAEAARIVEQHGADLCDINMGCPANKILKGCAGAALMGDLDLAARIVRDVRKAISIPLTVKFRAGLDDRRLADLALGRICQEEGADAVTLHPRTAKQMFRGRAARDRIAALVDALAIPVIGNGDVETADDAVAMLRETGCAGVMIGRASMKNPWIYRQATARLRGDPPEVPTLADRVAIILRHFELLRGEEDAKTALHKLRVFTGWYTHGLPEGRKLRVRIGEMRDPDEFVEAVAEFARRSPSVARSSERPRVSPLGSGARTGRAGLASPATSY